MLAATINHNTLRGSIILATLMVDALRSTNTSVPKEPHGVTAQKTAFFT
jgi:hypothetical protein